MKKRNKSLILLIVIFVLITAAGMIYTLGIQQKDLDIKDQKLVKLRANYSSLETLKIQLKKATEKVAVVDSLLFSGRFTIPQNLPQSNFFQLRRLIQRRLFSIYIYKYRICKQRNRKWF